MGRHALGMTGGPRGDNALATTDLELPSKLNIEDATPRTFEADGTKAHQTRVSVGEISKRLAVVFGVPDTEGSLHRCVDEEKWKNAPPQSREEDFVFRLELKRVGDVGEISKVVGGKELEPPKP